MGHDGTVKMTFTIKDQTFKFKEKMKRIAANAVLECAVMTVEQAHDDYSRKLWPPSSRRNQYPAMRSGDLTNTFWYSPTTIGGVAAKGSCTVGYGKKYGIYLVRKGRRGLLDVISKLKPKFNSIFKRNK
jgi:hypothetical protein